MELLLNFLWLMLALPAFLVWRRTQRPLGDRGPHCILVLGCVLALLFPVVSASDDLHPLRAEMEESSASKRAVKQSSGATSVAWHTLAAMVPLAVRAFSFTHASQESDVISEFLPAIYQTLISDAMSCRPPPSLT
jgi:hypothetical protein